MQAFLNSKAQITVATLIATRKKDDRMLFTIVFITALLAVPLFVLGGASVGYSTVVGGLVLFIGLIFVLIWPEIGLFAVVLSVVLVEQAALPTPIWTDTLNVFYWPTRYAGLFERPIGFFILFVFLVILLRHFAQHHRLLQGGAMIAPFLLFLGCVVMGIVHGLTSGGNLKITVVEIRPLWYMFVAYLLTYNLVKKTGQVRALFWIVILGAAIKGIQGVYIYLVPLHASLLDHREIMSHEESFFFVSLFLLILLFLLHSRQRAMLYAALLATPCVLIALIANQRRTDYVAFLVGAGVAWLLIFICKPGERVKLAILMGVTVVLLTGYIAAFAHSSGSIGAPARSIISVFSPSAGDASSNAYRQIEDYDLKYTVKQNPVLGLGFGKPFLQPITLPNILIDDPYYLYVPHNTIYWIWMRLGPLGYFALWFLFGSIIVRGITILRRLKNHFLQLVAIYIVAITVMEVIVAFADYQLFFYRNVIYLGILIGILMKLPSLDKAKFLSSKSVAIQHPEN